MFHKIVYLKELTVEDCIEIKGVTILPSYTDCIGRVDTLVKSKSDTFVVDGQCENLSKEIESHEETR